MRHHSSSGGEGSEAYRQSSCRWKTWETRIRFHQRAAETRREKELDCFLVLQSIQLEVKAGKLLNMKRQGAKKNTQKTHHSLMLSKVFFFVLLSFSADLLMGKWRFNSPPQKQQYSYITYIVICICYYPWVWLLPQCDGMKRTKKAVVLYGRFMHAAFWWWTTNQGYRSVITHISKSKDLKTKVVNTKTISHPGNVEL